LATELASLREQIGCSSRNSSKPPSGDGPGFKPPARPKRTGSKRGGQPGHPGSGPELLPIERVDEVMDHHPDACRRCGTLLDGENPDPLRHQVIEIPPITPVVIEHRLHRLVCPCCSTRTCATLEQPMQEALVFARQQPVAYVDETGAPTGNKDSVPACATGASNCVPTRK
jgi:transposase